MEAPNSSNAEMNNVVTMDFFSFDTSFKLNGTETQMTGKTTRLVTDRRQTEKDQK